MRPPLLRVPYTEPLPAPRIIPASATTASGAIAALVDFLAPSLPSSGRQRSNISERLERRGHAGKTLLLTGAGISVASGLADYRGANGTYTLNKTYRPIYFNEFCDNHEARKRYWARSFLGWTNLDKARPNRAHEACGELGRMGVVGSVITQSELIPLDHNDVKELCLVAHGMVANILKMSTPSTPPHILTCPPPSSMATSVTSSVSHAATNTRGMPSKHSLPS